MASVGDSGGSLDRTFVMANVGGLIVLNESETYLLPCNIVHVDADLGWDALARLIEISEALYLTNPQG